VRQKTVVVREIPSQPRAELWLEKIHERCPPPAVLHIQAPGEILHRTLSVVPQVHRGVVRDKKGLNGRELRATSALSDRLRQPGGQLADAVELPGLNLIDERRRCCVRRVVVFRESGNLKRGDALKKISVSERGAQPPAIVDFLCVEPARCFLAFHIRQAAIAVQGLALARNTSKRYPQQEEANPRHAQ